MDFNYIGQLYIINNGIVNKAPKAALTSSLGTDVTMSASENLITFLYLGKGDDGLHMAYDSVIVRVAPDAGDFDATPLSGVTMPVTFDATSQPITGAFNASGLMGYTATTGYTKQNEISPVKADFTAKLTTGKTTTDLTAQNNVFFSEVSSKMTVSGTYTSSGFFGPQNKGYNYTTLEYDGSQSTHTTTDGYVFFVGVNGVHEVDGTNGTDMMFLTTSATDAKVAAMLGILSVGDFGYWDVSMDAFGTVGPDWEGMPTGTAADGLTGDNIYGSVDFIVASTYYVMLAQSTVVSTVSSPGFGVVLSLFSIGIVAYAAPRLRKEQRK